MLRLIRQPSSPLQKENMMAKKNKKDDKVTAPEGQKTVTNKSGGTVIVDEDTANSDVSSPDPIAGTPKTKLDNNDENVLPKLAREHDESMPVDDDRDNSKPDDRARDLGDDPLTVSPDNINQDEGEDQHPTMDSEVTLTADSPNASYTSDPMTAAKMAKTARIEGHADGQRQRASTWWHPSGRVEDGEFEVKKNDGKVKVTHEEGLNHP